MTSSRAAPTELNFDFAYLLIRVYPYGTTPPSLGKVSPHLFLFDHQVIQMAEVMDSIPYEVLTSISSRVKRIYTQE